jgi:hypothetical protein
LWRRQGRDWTYTFTQEWPLASQAHQLSYSVPYLWLHDDGGKAQGFGDIAINYRLQVLSETAERPAFAPRVSLMVPTGDRGKGTGTDSVGYQLNLPFSKILSERVTGHFNAGHTAFVDVENHNPKSFNLGASVIYAVTRETNVMLEATVEWNEEVANGVIEKERAVTLSPGLRHAFNLEGDAQLVVGIGAPVTFTSPRVEYGVLLYLSYEHKFAR